MKPAGPTRLIAGAHRPGLFVRADTFPRRRALPAGPQYHADPLGKSLDACRAGIDATLSDFANTAVTARAQYPKAAGRRSTRPSRAASPTHRPHRVAARRVP